MAFAAAIVAAALVIVVAMVCVTFVVAARDHRTAAERALTRREERLAALEGQVEQQRDRLNAIALERVRR
jgi:hypothetical protein